MAKVRYHFNTKSLAVEKVNDSIWDKLKGILKIVASGLVFSVVVIFFAYTFFDSPKEKMLRREIEQYELQINLINDRLNIMSSVLQDIQHRDDNIYRVIFEAEPIPREVREAAFGGTDRYSQFEGYDNSDLITQVVQRVDKLARQMVVQSQSYDQVFEMVKDKAQMLASIPAIVPISKGTDRLISGFGYRIHPIYKVLRMHTGVDFTAPLGTPIYATGDGNVVKVENNRSGYGLLVVIDHGYGYLTYYAHMSKANVRIGQKIKRGEIVGLVGNSGISTAPHLHYEVIKNGEKVNPVNYFYNDLTPEEYEKVIEAASRVNQSLS